MEQPVKILVTGSNGQLGSELKQYAQLPGMVFDFTERATLQLTNETEVREYLEQLRPQYVINCAAYTAVDKAEEPAAQAEAEGINARAVGYLAKACTAVGAKLVHISTDYVFDGTASQPYKPSDRPNPVSVYGATKLKGEELAEQYTDAVIIRTAWVYSSFGKNFVKTMIRLMTERPAISVVADQYGSPTYAADLAAAVISIIRSGKWIRGIYHYTNEGETSWYEFAGTIRELINSACIITPIPTTGYPTPARRPAYSVLDKTGIKETYGIIIPAWRESLGKCIAKLQPH